MALGLSRWMPLINTPQIWGAPQVPCWVPLRSLGIRKRVLLAGLKDKNRQVQNRKRLGYSVANNKRTLYIYFLDITAHKYAIAPKNWRDQSLEGLGSQNKNNSWGKQRPLLSTVLVQATEKHVSRTTTLERLRQQWEITRKTLKRR